jgi:ferredoxin
LSFDKDYPNRKDKRKPHFGSKAIDSTCRSHGSCVACQMKLKYKRKKNYKEVTDEKHTWDLL